MTPVMTVEVAAPKAANFQVGSNQTSTRSSLTSTSLGYMMLPKAAPPAVPTRPASSIGGMHPRFLAGSLIVVVSSTGTTTSQSAKQLMGYSSVAPTSAPLTVAVRSSISPVTTGVV